MDTQNFLKIYLNNTETFSKNGTKFYTSLVSIFNDQDKDILKVVNHTSPPLEGRGSTYLDLS